MKALMPSLIGLVSFICLTSMPVYAENFDELAKRLVQLRGEVDDLSADMQIIREEHKQKVRFLASQKEQQQSLLLQAKKRVTLAQSTLQETQEKIKKLGSNEMDIDPILFNTLDELESAVVTNLPFMTEERQSKLAEIRSQLKSNVLVEEKAANQIWAFIQDELQLTTSSGLYQQQIKMNGQIHLVEVMRLGMAMLFFRLESGDFGAARKQQEDWVFSVLTNDQERQQVATLYKAMQKQIRNGSFNLPNVVALGEVSE